MSQPKKKYTFRIWVQIQHQAMNLAYPAYPDSAAPKALFGITLPR